MKKLSASLSLCVFLLLSCTSSHVRNTLSNVETFIMERPDSALSVLDSIDRSLLTTKRLKAHHALLHAMALDKNYIDVSDDSIARVAVDYFSKHGPEKYEARSLYYLGLAYYYQGEYNKAIVELTKAEEVAEGVDSLYLGFIKSLQADAYSKTYNDIEALDCLKEAYKIDVRLGNFEYIQTSKLGLAQFYYNINKEKESLEIISELLNAPDTDDIVKSHAMVSYLFMKALSSECNYKEIVDLYNVLLKDSGDTFMSERDYWAMTYALYKSGDKESAIDMMARLGDTTITATYWKYLIYKDEYPELALSYLEEYVKYNDIEVSGALEQSLALSQRDYYASQAEISEYKADNARQMTWIVVLLSLFLIFAVFVFIKLYIRRQEEVKEKYLAYINEINRQLQESKKDDYPALKQKYLSLYRSKFETIGELCEQYSTSHDLVNAESSVYRKVVSLVDDFKNDYLNKEKFEAMLDEDLDGIMSNLRTELPKLKEMDCSIFSLLVIGFDVTTISHILDVSMNTIYIRKSRIKQYINNLNPAHQSQFLEILT